MAGKCWLINSSVSVSTEFNVRINFTSNSMSFTRFVIANQYFLYYSTSDTLYPVYVDNTGWQNEAYRTVVFETEPTGDLLTWLQANAVLIACNKVVYGSNTLIDLTNDDVTASNVLKNKTFHLKDGTQAVGTAEATVSGTTLIIPSGLIEVS